MINFRFGYLKILKYNKTVTKFNNKIYKYILAKLIINNINNDLF